MVLLTALAAWVLTFFNVVPISSSSFSYSASSGFALTALCEACCHHYNLFEKSAFISYVEEHFFEDEWSLDVCAHRALKDGTFTREADRLHENALRLRKSWASEHQKH